MKTFAFLIAILLLSALSMYAQFQIPEIDKVKEIKLLQSTAFDVQRILVGFETEGWEPGDLHQSFSTENFSIDITYSSGECSEDDDEIWNAKQWTVTWIEIEPSDSLKVKNLGFDLSKFMKEQMYANRPETFIFHDKKKGLAYRVNEEDNEVRSIFIFPSKDTKVGVCKNDKAKEFVSSEGWFGKTKLADRTVIEDFAADITNLTLSTDQLENLTANRQVHVKAVAVDAENDALTYQYIVSGGRIIGTGPEVIWDLTGAPVGTYTITAGADDGCGMCGKTMTKTVTIK